MRRIVHFFGLLVISLSLNSCFSTSGDSAVDKLVAPAKPSVEYDIVEIEGQYSMKVPKFMSVTTQFQEEASLQYVNPFKEKYVTVMGEEQAEIMKFMKSYGVYDDSKSKLENYVDTRLEYLNESGISIINQTDLKSEVINGCDTYSIVIDAAAPDIDQNITYYFTYVEGESQFYVITSWTLFDRKNAFTDEVKEMTSSFKEL